MHKSLCATRMFFFIILLIGALLGYFIEYRQIVLTADQKEYEIVLNVQGFKLFLKFYYSLFKQWLCLLDGFGVTFFSHRSGGLDKVLKHEYSWLKSSLKRGKELRDKYPKIIIK